MSRRTTRELGNTSTRCIKCGLHPAKCKCSFAVSGPARVEDMAMLIRRLCNVVAKYDASSRVREQALDYLFRHNFWASPLKQTQTPNARPN